MKNMAILIDTNVVLDFLLDRAPFSENADKIFQHCVSGTIVGYIACHSLLNAFYVSRKERSVDERKRFLIMLCERFCIIGLESDRVLSALKNACWDDLEDGLQMQCAADEGLDYIITRDWKGFRSSEVQAISPDDFLKLVEWNKPDET